MDETQKSIIKEILNRIPKVYKTGNVDKHTEIFFAFFKGKDRAAFESFFGRVYSAKPQLDILCSVDYNMLKHAETIDEAKAAFRTYTAEYKSSHKTWSIFIYSKKVTYKESMENCVCMEFLKEKFPELYI